MTVAKSFLLVFKLKFGKSYFCRCSGNCCLEYKKFRNNTLFYACLLQILLSAIFFQFIREPFVLSFHQLQLSQIPASPNSSFFKFRLLQIQASKNSGFFKFWLRKLVSKFQLREIPASSNSGFEKFKLRKIQASENSGFKKFCSWLLCSHCRLHWHFWLRID